MKKLYTILGLSFLLIQADNAVAQVSFDYHIYDTIAYGAPLAGGDIQCYGSYIKNKTSSPLAIDVVRVQNVNLANGWASAFCLDICYADFVDSVRFTIPANDTVDFIPHFYITATPDSQTIYMKIKNVSTPTDVAYQRFHAVTKVGFSVNDNYPNLASVNIFPSPVTSGNTFTLDISNVKTKDNDFTIIVYSTLGNAVSTVTGLKSGNNSINLNLAAGYYNYSLLAGNTKIKSGNIVIGK